MKRLSLLLMLSISLLYANGQQGYTVGSTFYELNSDNSSLYYVQTENADKMKSMLDSCRLLSGNVKVIANLKDNSCIVNSRLSNKDHYISEIYNNKEGHKIIILPRIAIKLKDGYVLENVLSKYSRTVTFDQKKENLYMVDCDVDNSEAVLTINNAINMQEGVEWCEPMIIGEARKANTLESLQYYLNNVDQYGNPVGVDINVLPAWNHMVVDTTIVVAVLDDGVERNHEDLTGSVVDGYTLYYSNEKGDPINEYVNYHYVDPTTGADLYVSDAKYHGTACAGIIGARNNNIGIRGVASGVRILPINIHPQLIPIEAIPYPTLFYEDVGDAITWAYNTGNADVINCAMTFDSNSYISNALNNAMTYGRNGKGTVVVCASGNLNPYFGVQFPANMTNTIAVGAVNGTGSICSYSCTGSSLDIVAIGGNNSGDIVTTDRTAPKGVNPTDNYCYDFFGTSAACSQVAGVAALILSVNPDLSAWNVRNILQNTARKLPGMSGQNKTDAYGYGLVDADAAVKLTVATYSITGKYLISSSQTYSIDNLPTYYTVAWRLSNSYYNQYCLQQNYPSTNQCTITRSSSQDMMDATLTAYIIYNGDTIQTLTKTGLYAYSGFMGQYTSGNLSGTINYSHYLPSTPNSFTYIFSPNFYGGTASYNSMGTIPLYWQFYPDLGRLYFTMPTNNNNIPVVIDVYDGCGNYYQLFAIPNNSPYLNVSNDGACIIITLNGNGDVSQYINIDQPWTIEVRSATTGELKMTRSETSRSTSVSTSGWPKGIYIVKATCGENVLTEKIVLN